MTGSSMLDERAATAYLDRCAANGVMAGFEPDARPTLDPILSRV